jgi:hypothetical protein
MYEKKQYFVCLLKYLLLTAQEQMAMLVKCNECNITSLRRIQICSIHSL